MSIPNEIKRNMDRINGVHRVMIQVIWIYIWAAVFSSNVYLKFDLNDYTSLLFWKPIVVTAYVMSLLASIVTTIQNLNYLNSEKYSFGVLTWLFLGIWHVFMWAIIVFIA